MLLRLKIGNLLESLKKNPIRHQPGSSIDGFHVFHRFFAGVQASLLGLRGRRRVPSAVGPFFFPLLFGAGEVHPASRSSPYFGLGI